MTDASMRSPGPNRSVDSTLEAAERTLFAWFRTGLQLVAFGVVLERMDGWLCVVAPAGCAVKRSLGTAWLGTVFVILGVLTIALAIPRFGRLRRTLRMGASLSRDVFPIVFAAGLAMLGAALAIYLLEKLA